MKKYTSFEEINKDLKILRLERDVHKEEMKLSVHQIKEDLSFLNVVTKTTGFIVKRALALKVVNKLLGR
ncbi:DUF6327 family protein [Zhouia sp. PK063]|uniref:DUF6327 family protein n=1 Tax=Zhouia sp. PK063 TaxID=3373602 RepID=UPI0037A5C7EC